MTHMIMLVQILIRGISWVVSPQNLLSRGNWLSHEYFRRVPRCYCILLVQTDLPGVGGGFGKEIASFICPLTFDPDPLYLMRLAGSVQALPTVRIDHGTRVVLSLGLPSLAFPVMLLPGVDPLGDAVDDILGVRIKGVCGMAFSALPER